MTWLKLCGSFSYGYICVSLHCLSWHIQHPSSKRSLCETCSHSYFTVVRHTDALIQSAFARFWFWTNQHYSESLCCPYSRLATCNQLKITPSSLFCHFSPRSAPPHTHTATAEERNYRLNEHDNSRRKGKGLSKVLVNYPFLCHYVYWNNFLYDHNQIVWPGWNLIKTETSCWGLPWACADLYVKCQQTASRLWRQESIINIWLSAFKAKGRQRHWW